LRETSNFAAVSILAKTPGQNTHQRNVKSRPGPEHAPPQHAPISPARAAAFAILERVANTSAHSDDLLHGPGMSALSQADRNLATTLVLGVLRWQIALDALVQPLLQRPDPLPTPVSTAIRMGAFQLIHLDRIPAHAALSESVELARAAGHGHAAGMVNAILRKLTRLPPSRQPLVETTHALAQRLSHPLWLVERWQKLYGRANAVAICTADQHEPQPGALFLPATDSALPHMDDGSRLVAELAAASHPAPRRIWDCCAAPGGKTLILTHRHPNAELLATDINPRRMKALVERLHASAPAVRTLESDATQLRDSEGLFDLILCDVPCSGTGTLSRNPEIKERLQPAELSRQATRQREILAAALERLAPGGHLVYSTCSLEPEENQDVVAAVLATRSGKNVSERSLGTAMDGLLHDAVVSADAKSLLRDGWLRTLPGVGFQGDGFFASLFIRT
jgi:16S rRNA (cytosine967-C5)-methyltransferase